MDEVLIQRLHPTVLHLDAALIRQEWEIIVIACKIVPTGMLRLHCCDDKLNTRLDILFYIYYYKKCLCDSKICMSNVETTFMYRIVTRACFIVE